MIKYIAAFRSRSQTMRLFQLAKNNGINCAVINTPREASIGCGISVSYGPEDHRTMQNLVMRGGFNALIGYYRTEKTPNGRIYVSPI